MILFPNLFYFICIQIFILASSKLDEIGVDNNGLSNYLEQKTVQFRNNYQNQTIDLIWEGGPKMKSKLAEIPPESVINVDTTVSHRFFALAHNTGIRVPPEIIIISSQLGHYSFGPIIKKSSSYSLVKYMNMKSTSVFAKFRNLVPTTIDVWYEDGKDGIYQGSLDLGKEYTINSYEGHVFYFTEKGIKEAVISRFAVSSEKTLYIIEDSKRPPPNRLRKFRRKEEQFMKDYYEKKGLLWRHYFGYDGSPRPPPILHMWPADHIGQVHSIISREGYWQCDGSARDCHSKDIIQLDLEVVSTAPKIFIINNFLSEYETDQIISLCKNSISESTIGNNDGSGARISETRTSRNTWLGRETTRVTESIYARAEDLLNIQTLNKNNTEDLQVVHYEIGQRYDSHHDWGVSGYPQSRYITLLLYLNDMASPNAGGETAFPKAADGNGIKIHPGKGNAVLFYNLLEDGNGDDLSLHAALPVIEGEKWLANFWVWDPSRR